MLRHLLIFLLVMKESNMPGADVCSCPLTSVCRCNQGLTSIPENLPRPTYSLDFSVPGIVLVGTIILTICYKRRTKHPPLVPNPHVAGSNTNTAGSVLTSGDDQHGDDHQYEDIDNHHDQTGQGQSQAFTESNKFGNLSLNEVIAALITNTMYAGVETPPNDQTSTEMSSGHGKTGQAQSQDNIQSIRFGNLSLNKVLAALRPNSMYAGVETPPNDQTSTEMACGHDQTGQAQSQDNIQSIRFGNLSLDDVLAALRPNPMYAGVETPPNDQTSTEMACGHDQKGQDQSQTNIQSVKLENLSLDEVLAAFRPHSMHAGVETPPNHPASTEMASGHGDHQS
ncbi:PREDICTED: uncharacterized protein LOC109466870 [Branchiostoma belcheri]|uniref:Uncharacterized protein LOC109466870 n=1 Tax=Branchiostoma belcheri TaxID=7741 RepID=A0A6P4Y788_BRABE|nr:PREDICTED: uncharacterized protein LOC109466870 [Branchiostoma belcheri]